MRGALDGLTLATSAPAIYKALVEATVFGSRAIDERMLEEGVPIDNILAIGGMSAMEWRNRYLLLEAQELMERTDMSITEIAAKLGFSQPSVFSKFFRTLTKSQPWEWRIEKKKPGSNRKRTYHCYE